MILKSPEVIHPCCFDLWFGWRGEEFTTITPNNLLRIEHYPSSLWNRFFTIRQKHSRKPMFRASFFLEKYTRKLHPTGFSLESERWNNRENFLHSKAWRLFVEKSPHQNREMTRWRNQDHLLQKAATTLAESQIQNSHFPHEKESTWRSRNMFLPWEGIPCGTMATRGLPRIVCPWPRGHTSLRHLYSFLS